MPEYTFSKESEIPLREPLRFSKDTWDTRPLKTHAPFGYVKDKESAVCHPKPDVLELLSKSFDLVDSGRSSKEAWNYLLGELEKAGLEDKISYPGYFKLWKKYRPDARKTPVGRPRKDAPKKKVLSKEEKAELKKKRRIAAEKRKITFAQKRMAALDSEIARQQKKQKEQERLEKSYIEYDYSEVESLSLPAEAKPVFEPNPGPQTQFLAASELEVLYGGSAGGGKSFALIADPIRYFHNPKFVGLILRRTNDELREIKENTRQLYPQLPPEVTGGQCTVRNFSEKASEWKFPSGARLWLSYLDNDRDVHRYQGQAFAWVGFDELTQYPTPYAWNYLRSRLRSTDPELSKSLSMRATTNPGGPGHGWVKRMFIDPAPANTSFWATDIETGEIQKDPKTDQPLFRRRFIPAKLRDNPYLFEDGIYERNLLSLDEGKRAQLLEGDWTIADGAAFPEFREGLHVIEPFEVPYSWRKFRSMDWGYKSSHAVHWYAIDPMDNCLVCYREWYGGGVTAKDMAHLILSIEKQAGEKIDYGMLDSSVWHERGEGPSPAEIMIANGLQWRKADRSRGSREAGANMLHQLLRVNEEFGRPGILFFNTCRRIIADLQVAPSDPNGGDDIDEKYRQKNHAYDSLRYGIMSRPRPRNLFMNPERMHIKRPADRVFGY